MVSQALYHTRKYLPELTELENLLRQGRQWIRHEVVAEIPVNERRLPIHVLEMGSTLPNAPVLGLFGGVHGIERIGSQVILAFLRTLIERLAWDPGAHEQLAQVRLVIMPIVNPGGMWYNRRANPNGVDLMRNAPISAMDKVPFMVGGQRISKHLPWYRGKAGAPMEPENLALCEVVRNRLLSQSFSMSLDCHSGFGTHDRLWFPYARTQKPIEDLALAYQLNQLFRRTYPNHSFYLIEPQSISYTTHGDIWDYLYDESTLSTNQFLPLTLEMGSWLWVKKNPRQLFNFFSLFNPVLPHRHARILRRHLNLFDFLMAACRAHQNWHSNETDIIHRDTQAALQLWYDED
ncbi:MAG: DUF2817 domain-containing protein [Oceanospirillaceae bacterium]|nr:DUF2817 domain-containing protein [Oceanospirillaceae bacterium]MCP5350638.1 DUF2817 domain-containing protein [Oceanospirillaceae bacterium]